MNSNAVNRVSVAVPGFSFIHGTSLAVEKLAYDIQRLCYYIFNMNDSTTYPMTWEKSLRQGYDTIQQKNLDRPIKKVLH
jgi:hypothetical protein